MNKKVIKTMLFLIVIYLVAWYILKIFFPHIFLLQVNNEKLIEIGKFIDNNLILRLILNCILSYVTYFLYLGAICNIKHLNIKQSIIVTIIYACSACVEHFIPNLCTYYNIIAMIITPIILGCDNKKLAFVFTFHILCQYLSLSIRQLSTQVLCFNSLSCIIMTIECYFWLLLWYLWFNYNNIFKEEY